MARSSADDVVLMLPWLNCCAAATSRTPSPAVEALRLTAPEAYTSANSAGEFLKPTVSALAMLFEVMSSAEFAALRPDSAMLNVAMYVLLRESVRNLLNARERHAAEPRDVQSQPGAARAHGDAV